jgi:hypothetical protein
MPSGLPAGQAGDAPSGDAMAAFRRRLVQAALRKADDLKVLLQVHGSLSRERRTRDPEAAAENIKSIIKHLEGQILPPDWGEQPGDL